MHNGLMKQVYQSPDRIVSAVKHQKERGREGEEEKEEEECARRRVILSKYVSRDRIDYLGRLLVRRSGLITEIRSLDGIRRSQSSVY